MLVLITLQNICQLFDPRMASSKSSHPESNQGQSDLCKLYSQMLYQLSYSRLDTLSHFCVCHPCGGMEILRRRLSHFCACHPCGAMEILQGASNSHG